MSKYNYSYVLVSSRYEYINYIDKKYVRVDCTESCLNDCIDYLKNNKKGNEYLNIQYASLLVDKNPMQNKDEIVNICKKYSDTGNGYASFVLAREYRKLNDNINYEHYLYLALKKKYASAYYYYALDNEAKEYNQLAFEYYKKAAKYKHSLALNNLGRCYLYGIGISKNFSKAIKCLDLAIKYGETKYPYFNLGKAYLEISDDNHLSKKYFTMAIEAGNKYAYSELGDIYYDEHNYKKAFEYYELSLNNGFYESGEYILSILIFQNIKPRDLNEINSYIDKTLKLNENSDYAYFCKAIVKYLENRNLDEYYNNLSIAKNKNSKVAHKMIASKSIFSNLKNKVDELLKNVTDISNKYYYNFPSSGPINCNKNVNKSFVNDIVDLMKHIFRNDIDYFMLESLRFHRILEPSVQEHNLFVKHNKVVKMSNESFLSSMTLYDTIESKYFTFFNILNIRPHLFRLKELINIIEKEVADDNKKYLYLISKKESYDITVQLIDETFASYSSIQDIQKHISNMKTKEKYERLKEYESTIYDDDDEEDDNYDFDYGDDSSSSFPYFDGVDEDGNEVSINTITGTGSDGKSYSRDYFSDEWYVNDE